MDLTPVMSVFIDYTGGSWTQVGQILMGKRQVISVVGQFLYLLTDQGSLLGHTLMMEMELTPVMSVFTITMDRLGCKLEQILMGKR